MTKFTKDNINILPVIIAVTFVPLIVYLKVVELEGAAFEFWTGADKNWDFFSYYKALFLQILAVFAIAINYNISEYKKSPYYLPVAGYFLFIVLSSIFSAYPQISLFGFVDRYEGALTLGAYLILFIVSINFVNRNNYKIMLLSFCISASIVGLIGIFQFFGLDFFRTDFGRGLILPQEWQHLRDSLKFNFGKGTIYTTLYNTNFVGSFTSMFFLLSLPMAYFYKNSKYKYLVIPFNILMFANWIGCRSRAGFVGGSIAIIFLIVLFRKIIIREYKTTITLFLLYVIVFALMDMSTPSSMFHRYTVALLDQVPGINLIQKENDGTKSGEISHSPSVKNIVFEEKNVQFIFPNRELNVRIDGNSLRFFDEEDKVIDIAIKDEKIILSDDRYKDININTNEKIEYLNISTSRLNLVVVLSGGRFYLYNAKKNKVIEDEVERLKILDGYEHVGSERGYIWSRSIPLLKHTILWGFGPDTYAAHFPQHDVIGKNIAYGGPNIVVDKPHNMYLQIAINTGIISLIFFLWICIYYFKENICKYFKMKYENPEEYIGVGIFAGIMGYLGAGFFNDSVVSVAPLFWVLLGTGIAINQTMKLTAESDSKNSQRKTPTFPKK